MSDSKRDWAAQLIAATPAIVLLTLCAMALVERARKPIGPTTLKDAATAKCAPSQPAVRACGPNCKGGCPCCTAESNCGCIGEALLEATRAALDDPRNWTDPSPTKAADYSDVDIIPAAD